jgi:putative membrane protein
VYVKHAGEPNEKIVPLVQENILPSQFSGDPQMMNAIIFALAGLVLIFGMEFVAKKMKSKNT